MFGWLKRTRPETVTDPNGRERPITPRHHAVMASDGALHCDRCRNGDLLACMDACGCGRVG